jgi:hypothetical protein
MSKEVSRLVPWTSWDEWKQVCAWLWSDSSDEQLMGIKRVRKLGFDNMLHLDMHLLCDGNPEM